MRRLNWITAIAALAVAFSVQAAEGEFDNNCTMGLAMKQQVPTDCSVNWVAEDGKTYCFSNEEAKAAFLKDAQGNLATARVYWEQSQSH